MPVFILNVIPFSILIRYISTEGLSVFSPSFFKIFLHVSILCYNFIEFNTLLYKFLVIPFARYKKYMICLILFSKFSDVFPAFTWASAIGNSWSIFLVVNILIRLAKSEGRPLPFYCLLKSWIFLIIFTISFGFSFPGFFLF